MDFLGSLEFEDIIPIIAIGAAQASQSARTPLRTGLSRHEYVKELLSSNPKRIYEVLRIKKETFFSLCRWLEQNTTLKSTWRITIEEQVVMFI
jgi:hypothetical protein